MAVEIEKGVEVYDIKAPYLLSGRLSDWRSQTDMLSVMIKVYAEGGENRMHAHPNEDHSFVILEGEATFYLETEDNTRVVGPYEGIMLPKGANYCFKSTGEGNLVLLRVGAAPAGAKQGAIYPDGGTKSFEKEPNWSEPVAAPGPGFGG
jgi:mannose-6-phosphate isomerase-like protein (cupin superfamily)